MGEANQASSGDADALVTKFLDEFGAKVDDTFVMLLVSERIAAGYDPKQLYEEVHSILTNVSQNSAAEEASIYPSHDFTAANQAPSSVNELTGLEGPDNTETSQSTRDSARLLSDSSSSNTDWGFSLSDNLADLEISDDVNVASLDEDGKVTRLKMIFGALTEMDLRFALRKCKGDFVAACDEALNIQFLEENGLRPKGIEGAFRDDSTYHPSRSGTPKEKNQDNKGKKRLNIPYNLTPVNLSEDSAYEKPTTPRTLTPRRSLPRLTLAAPSTEKITVSAPISPAIRPSGWQTVTSKKKPYNELVSEAEASRVRANCTRDAANAAYIRGKSDPFFRSVAGLLSERANEQRNHTRLLEAEMHEANVDRRASSNSIDLHGVPVAHGVRIALDRTDAWWRGLGENRAKKARQQGFSVVTGLGNHSASGVSRLRQEVGAALKRDGWYVRTETGHFVVTGRQ